MSYGELKYKPPMTIGIVAPSPRSRTATQIPCSHENPMRGGRADAAPHSTNNGSRNPGPARVWGLGQGGFGLGFRQSPLTQHPWVARTSTPLPASLHACEHACRGQWGSILPSPCGYSCFGFGQPSVLRLSAFGPSSHRAHSNTIKIYNTTAVMKTAMHSCDFKNYC